MRILWIMLFVLTLAPAALASDGMLEINQACATSAGGCFAGDAAGFPVTITQQGSYLLTGNLSVPLGLTAIQINSTLVTLDLGGFVVSSANVCVGNPVTGCTINSGAPGIVSPTASQFLGLVRNGKVTGFGGACIDLEGDSSAVHDVSVFFCGRDGIRMGLGGRVAESFSGANFGSGIDLLNGGSAVGNETRANQDSGIVVAGSAGGSLLENRAIQNGAAAFQASGSTHYLLSKNIATANGSTFVNMESLGDNVCNGVRC